MFQPLFVELAFTAPHFPVQAPQEYIDMFKNTIADENRRIYVGKTALLYSTRNRTHKMMICCLNNKF